MLPYQFQPTLAIKSLDVDEDDQTVHLEAQPDGIFAAIARMFGLGGRSKLKMSENGFWLTAQSFSTKERVYVPLANVASSILKESKPIEILAAGVGLMFTGVPMLFSDLTSMYGMVVLLIALGAVIGFFFANQRVTIGVITNGGTAPTLKIKAKGNTLEDLRSAAKIIEELVDLRSGGGASSGGDADDLLESEPTPTPSRRSSSRGGGGGGSSSNEKISIECPHCSVRLKLRASKKGTDVTCPSCQEEFVA